MYEWLAASTGMEADFLVIGDVLSIFLNVTLFVWFGQEDSAMQLLADTQRRIDKLRVCFM